jgi:hypothetical protein
VKRLSGSHKKHGYAALEDILERFEVEQTGKFPHHTVKLPKPVTDEDVSAFNKFFFRWYYDEK